MLVEAPLCVPVELAVGERWFRLAQAISVEGVLLRGALPTELADEHHPIQVWFHLPEDARLIATLGRPMRSAEDGEALAVARTIRFIALEPPDRERIARYVEERTAA